MIHWVTTQPHPDSPATGYDAGQRGWRLHAIEAPSDAKFSDVGAVRAACGLRPAHGWGMDMFIERRCDRCVVKLGVSTPMEDLARKQQAKSNAERIQRDKDGIP